MARIILGMLSVFVVAVVGCDRNLHSVPESEHGLSNEELLIEFDQVDLASRIPVQTFKLLPPEHFSLIEWTDLIPEDDLDALLNPPAYVTDVEDGSEADQIRNNIANTITVANSDSYQKALASTRIIDSMNNVKVRIPGFIVPLEFDDNEVITQFFLVPFFGACIHLPPPPPNQMIFVDAPYGVAVEAIYDPFFISGVLTTTLMQNDIAVAAYSMQMHHFSEYTQ